MEPDEPIEVFTLNDPYKAEIIRGALQAEGIHCQLDGERQAGFLDILPIGVLVRARDADRARRIIEQSEARGETAEADANDDEDEDEDESEQG